MGKVHGSIPCRSSKIMEKLYYEGKPVESMTREELIKALYTLARINDELREIARRYNERLL